MLKTKQCSEEGCNSIAWKNGKCKSHCVQDYHLKNRTKLKSTTILKSKPKTQEEKDKNKEETKKMWNFFLEIWKERPHYSEISGKYLGETPLSVFFDHLLEKNDDAYPELKYEKDNIILCTFEEHQLKNNGFPLPKHKEFIEKAKEKFLK